MLYEYEIRLFAVYRNQSYLVYWCVLVDLFAYKKSKESDILVPFTSQERLEVPAKKMLEVPAKKITSWKGFQLFWYQLPNY